MNRIRTIALIMLAALLLTITATSAASVKTPAQPLIPFRTLIKKYGKPVHLSTSVDKRGFIFNCATWAASNGLLSECVVIGKVTVPTKAKPSTPGA